MSVDFALLNFTPRCFSLAHSLITYSLHHAALYSPAYLYKSSFIFRYLCLGQFALCSYLSTFPIISPSASLTIMATLRLQVTDGSAFIVRRLQKTPSEAAKISAMVAAKLRSPLVFCPRCTEGQHPQETICLPTQVADTWL